MSTPGAGILLALSGDDADILRALSQAGSGLCVVRRCADLPELLSAGMAGLASFALMDTGFDEIDRTVLDRLSRAGLSGLLLVEAHEEQRWRSAGWPVLRRDAAPGCVRSVLQDLVRRASTGPSAPTPGSSPGSSTASGTPSDAAVGPPPTSDDWLSAATPASPASTASPSAAQETAWLEDLWRLSPGPDRDGEPAAQPGPAAPATPPSTPPSTPLSVAPSTPPVRPHAVVADPSPAEGTRPAPRPGPQASARDGGPGRIVVVWGPHGAPGRSTVAASLAHGLAPSGGAILVDADVEAPSLVQVLGMPEDSSALAGAARLATHGRLDAESFQRVLAPVGAGVSLLGGLGRAGRWRELPPASMTEVWLQCRQAAAWTVVDVAGGVIDDDVDDFTLEPGRGAVTADLVSRADVVLMVGGADPVGVRRLLQLLDEVGSSVTPTGRVEVVVNRVRASAAGPSPQQALREALARFGGLEDIVLLPEDAATADTCLLQGRSVLEGSPGSPLGKALSALVDRIDPQASGARKGRSSRRSLLRRRKKHHRAHDSADKAGATGRRRRSAARGKGGRGRRGDSSQTAGTQGAAPGTARGGARAPQSSQRPAPPSTWPSPSTQAPPPPPGPARWPGATPWQGAGSGPPDPGADRGPGRVLDAGQGAARGGDRHRGRRDDRGHEDPPSVPPGSGRHRY
ncbi:hypothetical protein [Actinomyces viscosus]|uniref:AAA family ATPase n=1 Tax=Actinomyces viscosus TaxID=1656 RepID=UPI0028E5F0A5|nr:hypothetical protein [Actinomyces viscosus]